MLRSKKILSFFFFLVAFLSPVGNTEKGGVVIEDHAEQSREITLDMICGVQSEDILSLIQSIDFANKNFLYEISGNTIHAHMWWNAIVGLNSSLEVSWTRESLEKLILDLRKKRRVGTILAEFIQSDSVYGQRNAEDFFFFFTFLCEYDLLRAATNPLDRAMEYAHKSLGNEFTHYYSAENVARSSVDMFAALPKNDIGVGITLFRKERYGPFTVLEVEKDSSAHMAQIRTGDLLFAIDGKTIVDQTVAQTIHALRGKNNSRIVLTIQKKSGADAGQVMNFTLIRTSEPPEVVSYEKITEKTFLLKITTFSSNRVGDEVRSALKRIASLHPAPNIILDLRGNRGGLLYTTINVAQEFMSSGDIVYTEDNTGKISRHRVNFLFDRIELGNIVVLVDGTTASSAEILAAALKSRGAKLIGRTTFGKGVGQLQLSLPNGGVSSVTNFHVFTPTLESFHKIGLKPDIFASSLDFTETGSALLTDNAIWAGLYHLEGEPGLLSARQ